MSLEISGSCDVFEEYVNGCSHCERYFIFWYYEYLSCKESVLVITLEMSNVSYFSLFKDVSQ